ncbi:autotransporter-associated N-terminal domain-containing protein [Fusobacterium ulcerans]|uniref:autotransporter-associated N-terminal domain-containing protein n=1 Tax=Fusobacterium ulcerans TaxID=861 RepID=UPI001E4AE9EE|nr:autotransporter-associated N-terminal domain-containing protein [Fusobacterium ulcerans]
MRKGDIEKSLKRFLKRKVSYSLALLISFMIIGGISLGAEITAEEIQESKGDLLSRIQTEREEIKRKIVENERLIKEYNSNFVELVRKGDFYSKPLFNSTQVFFSYQHLDSGKMKDVTDKEFSETIDAINKHYETRSGRSILKSTGNIGKDKLIAGNGVAVDTEVFRETIEVGANIKPVVPVLPEINKVINVSIGIPQITGVPNITPSSPNSPTAPPSIITPTINVTTPGAVASINVTAPTVTTPTTPAEKNITVSAPTAPGGYEPTMINPPKAPSIQVIVPINISTPSIAGSGANPSVQYFWWDGNDGVISQISLKSGEYIINGNSGNYSVGVTGYDAEAFSGTSPQGSKPTDGTYTVNEDFFHTLLNVPYSYYGENVKITFNSNNAKLIDLETEGIVNGNLDDRVAEGLITSATRDRLREYQTYTGIKGEDNTELLFVNKGKVEINGTNSAYFFTTSHTDGGLRTNYLDNEGTIIVNGDKSAVYMHSPDTQQSKAYIYSNGPTGKIYVDGVGASLMQWVYSNLDANEAAFVNEGTAEIRGAEAIALYMSDNKQFKNGHAAYIKKPIELLGDKSIGLVAQNTNITNEKNIVKFSIGKKKQTIAKGNSVNNIFVDRENDPNLVEQAIGILMDNLSTTKTAAQIEIGEYSYGGIGIFANNGTIEILKPYGVPAENSSIKISGGEGNIGIIAQGGDVKFEGDILIENGKNNQIAIAQNGKKITINGNATAGDNTKKIEDSVALYAKDSGTAINIAEDKLSLNLSGDSIAIYSTDNGEITANRSSLDHSETGFGGGIIEPTAPVNIYVEGTTVSGLVKGVGLFANNGGKINTKNTYVKVKDGSVGIASIGSNSNVDITNGIVDYEGNGYAVYSDGVGTVNLTDGEIILRGKATALELDLNNDSSPNPITLTGAKIVVMSNDAVGVNLKNIGALNIGTLKTDIEAKLGGVNIVAGTDGNQVFDKYKIAAVDGGTLNINAHMNKSDTDTTSTGFFYYRRFLGQRLNLNVLANIEVKSEINSSDAEANFKGQVVGLEMNSSKSAASATDAQINLAAGSKVIADRTDTGVGAIGLYMNFGKIDITAGAGVEVEKGANTVNDKAVGVYAVNGSKVDNAGNIEVKGNQSIGILGMAYREDDEGNILTNEFGTGGIFAEQGKVTITNTGNIALDGIGTIGIYANNNNTGRAAADNVVTNDTLGTITVGDSDNFTAAIGIYGKKATIANKGNITVGSGGVAIYATEGSNVTKLGTLKLGSDGIGVMLDGTSTLEATTVTLESKENTVDINGKTGIFYKGSSTGSDSQDIDLDINASNFVKGTAIYVQDMNVTSSGSLTVGTEGIGIFVAKTGAGPVISRIGTNQGTIELEANEKAIGMYGKDTTIANETGNGIINVGNSSQIGMYADGANGKAINKGTIKLKVDGATGIYVKSGATAELDTNNNIVFDGKSSIGVYAEGAKVNFKDNLTFANNNENKNIYVYGKDSAVEITDGKTVTVNGMGTPTTLGNKTVGIYLENAGTGSTVKGTGELKVENGAIGIYSKGNNSLDVKVTATGDKTTGVFIDGESKIKGTVTATGNTTSGAIGVYGSGGAVNIDTELTLNIGTVSTTNKGTGMYLTDGAYATGGKITVNNSSTGNNIGVYYSKGTASGPVTNRSEIELTGKNGVGIYAADGITLVNNSDITSTAGQSDSIASYIGGGSQLTSTGIITMNDNDSIGIYVEEGKGINSGTITMNGAASASSKSVVGMIAKAVAGKTATIENTTGGTITAGANLGMYVGEDGTSIGINAGNINVTSGTGVFVKGTSAGFNGAGGTISITGSGTGIILEGTGAGKITNAGTIALAAGSVGVYGKSGAKIDFPVTINGTGGTGIYAESGTVVSGTINAGNSKDTVAVYLADDTASVNGAVITAGEVTNIATGSAIGLYLGGSSSNHTVGNSTINASASGAVGIYTEDGNRIEYSSTTNVKNGAVGIYLKDLGTTLNANAGTINITGNGIGVYAGTGTIANLGTTGNLTVNFNGNGGILSYNDGGTVNLGANIVIGSGAGTLAATKDGSLSNSGTITVGNGSAGLLGEYSGGSGYSVKNDVSGVINVQTGGFGLAATKDENTAVGNYAIVENNGEINVSGKDAVGMYNEVGDITNTSIINVTDNGIGMYLKGQGNIDVGTLNVTKGVGYVIEGTSLGTPSGTITLHTGDKDNYSIGGYYLNTLGTINLPTITDADYSIKAAIKGGTNTVNGAISVTGGQNKVGILTSDSTTALGAITVGGKENIGVLGTGSNLSITSITVQNSSLTATEDMSVGVVLNGGSYNGTGNVLVGNNGIGLYATGMQNGNINYTGGSLQVGNSALGFYGEGTKELSVSTTGITIGDNNSIGVYAKGMNTSVTGDIAVGTNTSIGIVSEGNGNVTQNGDIIIADKGNGKDDKGSVGIYKLNGGGIIETTMNTTFNVGVSGYGIFVKQNAGQKASQSATINNKANMTLGMAAVGIYSSGTNTVNNSGTITVGKTNINGEPNNKEKHLNSVGIYVTNGTTVNNTGTINVKEDFSVGIYGSGEGTHITNASGATINVDKGGVGILVQNGAVAVNAGTINLGNVDSDYGAITVGMAAYNTAEIINNGVIKVDKGAGMVVGINAKFQNNGYIEVKNGVGIEGQGILENTGNIVVIPGYSGTKVETTGVGSAEVGSIKIDSNGDIHINGNYIGKGGTISTVGNLVVNGAYVDVTTGMPVFNAGNISGEVNILPNFALTGNGITYVIQNFVNAVAGALDETKFTPITSPLFIAKVTGDGDLTIAKRPYADLTIGTQFDALDKGLDNILANSGGIGKDAEILKGLNAYLEGLSADQFEGETSRKLAETRGDIYSTIQGRMQDINRAFDNSFYELESSYNLTKDSSKYSVIYTDGDYKDPTLGIEDYDYKIMGLLYMKEKEGTEYGSKYGYTLGFTGSRFEFENDSKEDVYSLRAGVHRVKNLSEEHKVSWLSRIELGYNRHIAERKLNLHETFENKGEYNTYSVALDNRITKVIYTDLSRELDIYADLDLEYGKVDGFTESAGSNGGLEVQIKDNDYLSAQLGAGVKASQRIYAGNDVSVKVTADVKYAYELGDNYDGNKARLKMEEKDTTA